MKKIMGAVTAAALAWSGLLQPLTVKADETQAMYRL